MRNVAEPNKNPFVVANKLYGKIFDTSEANLFLKTSVTAPTLGYKVQLNLLPHHIFFMPQTYRAALVETNLEGLRFFNNDINEFK